MRSGRVWHSVGLLGPLAATLALCFGATAASGFVVRIGGHTYGVAPINGVSPLSMPGAYRSPKSRGKGANGVKNYDAAGSLINHGGPVMHSVSTHVIYWDPKSEFTETTKGIVNNFFTNVAQDSGLSTNVFGVAGQYTDGTGHAAYSSTFEGAAVDPALYPSSGCTVPPSYTDCITDEQLQSQLSEYIVKHGLPRGSTQQYFVLLPHKVVTCLPEEEEVARPCSNNVFCAYHGAIGSGGSEIIYSNIPFSLLDTKEAKLCQDDGNSAIQLPNGDSSGTDASTRYADVALKYISHEYIEASTDPLGESWFDGTGREIGDKCNSFAAVADVETDPNAFRPILGGEAVIGTLFDQAINAGHYYIQSEWDNAGGACLMRPVALSAAKFIAPASAPAGVPVQFEGSAIDIYSGLGFTWKWGDGSERAGSSPTHTYVASGTYEVTMTATDELTGATTPAVTHTITVLRRAQAIGFTSSAPSSATVGGPAYAAAATASSGLTVSLSAGSPSVCTVSGAIVSFLAPGTCAINANQVGNGAYEPAPPVQQSFAVSVGPAPSLIASVPNSSFSSSGPRMNSTTGAITFTVSLSDPGTLSWLLTFQNGGFGVFAASNSKCKKGFVRLNRKCRPSRVVFGKGGESVSAPGSVTFTVHPSPSALKALKRAAKQKKGLPVAVILTFQSARGGTSVTRAEAIILRLRKK